MVKKKTAKKKKGRVPAKAVTSKKKAKPVARPAVRKVAPREKAPIKKVEREPVKKILRADSSLVVVAKPTAVPAPAPAIEKREPIAPPVRAVPPPQPKREASLPPRVGWSDVPASFPPQTRFYTAMAEKECESASRWPFPFARFLAALPKEVCGMGLSMMLMSLDLDIPAIAAKIDKDEMFVSSYLARERSGLLDACSNLCPEMFRKIKTQLTGTGVSIDTLVERYVVAKVDKSFQLTIGALVLRALADQEA